jgi:perosamine synthetase
VQPAQAVEAVRSVIGDRRVRLHEPLFIGNERKYLDEALASGQVAYGPFVQRFEDKLCEITGRKYAVALSSGTAALHLAVGCVFANGPVDMPALCFVATANAVRHCGWAVEFYDGLDDPLNVPPDIGVDALGRLTGGCLIEDAAPALGTIGAGHKGSVACFSFNGNKICTAGGGGAVVTDDQGLADQIRHLANQAKSSPTEHDAVGFNYRMPNLNAALGLAQLECLPEFLERKQRLADRYARAFGDLFWKPPEGSNNWLNAILVDNRDEVVSALNAAGYESRALHAPLHTLPMYRDCPRGDMTRTMEIWNRCVCLPSGAGVM